MHLYSTAIASITWADIEHFCQQGASENTYLEYKRDFPNDLAKTIAAMANTLGGLVLIGVDETDEGKPRLPLAGITVERGLDERVLNTILDNMTPPIIPEIVTCANDGRDKAIIVIRVPQSENAPHALHRNTAVYVRTGKRNKPEDLADLDRLDWMHQRRRKSEELRERIYQRACSRFLDLRDGRVLGVPASDENWPRGQEQPGLLTISLCPLYPEAILIHPVKLETVRRKIGVKDYVGTDREFPIQGAGCIARMVEDGLIMHFSGVDGLRTYHTHLNMHGLFLFRQSLSFGPAENLPRVVIRGYEILCRLYEIVESGAKFYSELGYWGPLKFRLQLEGILGLPLLMPDEEYNFTTSSEYYSTDRQIEVAHEIRGGDLTDRPHDVVLGLAERVGWAYNSPISLEWLRSFYGSLRK